MIVLSERESQMLRLIKQRYEERSDLPTVMELSRQSGIYYMDVFRSLRSLDEKGYIELSHTDKHVEVKPLWWE